MAASPSKPLQLFKQKEFKQIQVLAYDNMMKAVPSPSVAGAATTSPANTPAVTNLHLGSMTRFLQNIPETFAAGIRPMARTLAVPPKILVLANAEGQTLNTFAPFPENSNGALQSPLILPGNERILYVEVVENTPHLKTVTTDFDPATIASFGAPALEGWEPHLTPDNQFIIFRQGLTQLVRTDLDGQHPTLLLEDASLGRLVGVFSETADQNYVIVYSKQQDNRTTYWAANVQGDTVIPQAQPLDEHLWKFAEHLNIRGSRLLYEQEDTVSLVKHNDTWVIAGEKPETNSATTTQTFFNIYLSDSAATAGHRITNTHPGSIPDDNRYPVWSPDGSKIVYVSTE